MHSPHPAVHHPSEILEKKVLSWNEKVLEWLTNNVLASVMLFDIALIVPLLALPAPTSLKLTLGVISGSWIQWWALPALQRSQNKTQAQNEAKAQVDHETLTYLAHSADELMSVLQDVKKVVSELPEPAPVVTN